MEAEGRRRVSAAAEDSGDLTRVHGLQPASGHQVHAVLHPGKREQDVQVFDVPQFMREHGRSRQGSSPNSWWR